jgi:hypothetical protein
MKKLVAVLLVMVMVLGMSGAAFAAPRVEKDLKIHDVQSMLVVQEFDVIYVGDDINLIASTPKHGSDYIVQWSVSDDEAVVTEGETVLETINEVDTYVSTATFSANKVGLYVVTYKISMAAGKSHVSFVGEIESEEIEVVGKATEKIEILSHEIKIIGFEEQNKNQDKVSFEVTVNYNNGDTSTYEFNRIIGKTETSKDFNVGFSYQGNTFNLSVTIIR